MSSRPELKLDWCSHEAAKYAVEKWHYSKSMPAGKQVRIGVWEGRLFTGVVCFSWGANNHIGSPYKLAQTEICELVRIALNRHESSVSRIVSVALKMLKRQSSGLRLVVSYADPEQGHIGAVYQAGNWIYVGSSQPQKHSVLNGKLVHKRTVHAFLGSIKGVAKSQVLWKHKYLMPLDAEMRRRIEPLRKPYPKRACEVKDDTLADQAREGGETPTRTLQAPQ